MYLVFVVGGGFVELLYGLVYFVVYYVLEFGDGIFY